MECWNDGVKTSTTLSLPYSNTPVLLDFPISTMPGSAFTDDQLAAYLDEMLPVDEMTAVEKVLRSDAELQQRLAGLSRRRDHGVHSVGEIWRRQRLSCPDRRQLGGYLLGTNDPDYARYVEFHIRTIGCRVCAANLIDLEQQADTQTESTTRRRKFFQSSVGLLRS